MRAVGYAALVCGWAWMAGVALGTRGAVPGWLPLAVALASVGIVSAIWRPGSILPLLPLALAALLFGNARFSAVSAAQVDELHRWVGETVVVEGTVVDDAAPTAAGERATVEVERLTDSGGVIRPVRDRLVVYAPPFTGLLAGERLRLEGELHSPSSMDGFDQRAYFAGLGAHAKVERPTIERIAAPADGPSSALGEARRAVNAVLAQALPEPAAGIAQGLVTGERAALAAETRDAFARTNTTHLLAVSGTNVALVIASVQPLFARLRSRWVAFFLTILVIAGYAALVGPQPSALRATVMGGLVVWARLLGRPSDAHTALALAGVALTATNPLWIHDLGFVLSFLATAGLLCLAPPIAARLSSLPALIREPLALTLAATLATLPVLARSVDQASLVGPAVNLAVAPLVGPATILALLLAPLALASPTAAAPLAWVEWLLLAALDSVVAVGAALPFASTPLGWLADGFVFAYYATLATSVLGAASSPLAGVWPSSRAIWTALAARVPAARLCLALLAIAGVTWAGALGGPSPKPVVTFLAVGQGDATLIQTPEGRVVLVDGGPTVNGAVQALDRRLPFWRRRVDLIVLTHPHDDHLVGLVEVLRRYDVGAVLDSGLRGESPAWGSFDSALGTRSVPRHVARVGDHVELGAGLRLSVVGAPELVAEPESRVHLSESEVNDSSLVLRLDSPSGAIVLTGDAGAATQRRLLESGAHLRAALLKVPHHGAAGLYPGFLRAVDPDVAVISVGAGNRFGHPAPSTTELIVAGGGCRLFRTDEDGSVEIALATEGLRVRTQH